MDPQKNFEGHLLLEDIRQLHAETPTEESLRSERIYVPNPSQAMCVYPGNQMDPSQYTKRGFEFVVTKLLQYLRREVPDVTTDSLRKAIDDMPKLAPAISKYISNLYTPSDLVVGDHASTLEEVINFFSSQMFERLCHVVAFNAHPFAWESTVTKEDLLYNSFCIPHATTLAEAFVYAAAVVYAVKYKVEGWNAANW